MYRTEREESPLDPHVAELIVLYTQLRGNLPVSTEQALKLAEMIFLAKYS